MDITRTYVYANGNKQSMLNRLLSYLSFNGAGDCRWRARHVAATTSFCAATGRSSAAWRRRLIGRVKGAPFIYNVQDLYPETPVQAGQISNTMVIAALEKLERFMYAQAAHVASSRRRSATTCSRKNVPVDKVATIPNFVDMDFIRPYPKDNAFSREHGLTEKFVVTHAGNLGYVYDLDALLDVAQRCCWSKKTSSS